MFAGVLVGCMQDFERIGGPDTPLSLYFYLNEEGLLPAGED